MKKATQKEHKTSWFWRWFLNNQVVTALLVVLLLLLIMFMFTKVSYLFAPLGQFFGIVGFPILLAGIFYYFLNPLVDWLEKKGLRRLWGTLLIFAGLIALMVWGIVSLVPMVQNQALSFIENWPVYWRTIEYNINEILTHPLLSEYAAQLNQISDNVFETLTNLVKNLSKNTFQGLGSFIGTVANVVVTAITMPFILFYLLKDGKDLVPYLLAFLPTKIRKPTLTVLTDMNAQVSQYIRGQLAVAFSVAVMFVIGFSVIGLEYSVMLGIFAGFMNLIPYLGSALATIPAIVIALVDGPRMLIYVLIVFILEQLIEGRFVSPLVLGSQLKIHPVTIIFVLLTAGKLFGVVGVIIGIPGYAALKVLITHLFEWYKEISQLYAETEERPAEANDQLDE